MSCSDFEPGTPRLRSPIMGFEVASHGEEVTESQRQFRGDMRVLISRRLDVDEKQLKFVRKTSTSIKR